LYQAREFAELAGVTVRTLHHYDRIGLLKPRRRTHAGYRLYEADDLERLEQIIALKYLGLSLGQIGTLLDLAPQGFADALHMQRRLLEEKRRTLDRAIQAIGEAESQLRSGGAAGTAILRKIIEVIEMESDRDWMARYATEEGRAKIEARQHLWSPELQERVGRQWNELIADVDAALGEEPTSRKARALAARWNGLVEEFTGGDKDIEQSAGNMWADRENWPAHMDPKAPVIKPEVWAFIKRVNDGANAGR
jgi:MerR family transcriptional regulator, thiopeptide resistance regulator